MEYIQARSHEELAARAAAGGVAKAGAKIVGDSLGDAAKKGLFFGDEDENVDEKRKMEELNVKFTPLLNYLKGHVGELVREGKYI